MHKLLPLIPLAAALALPVAAQETSAGSALTIRTTDVGVAMTVLGMFGADTDVSPPAEGGAIVLSLDDGGNMISRTGEGTAWLQVDADPRILMQIFAPQIQQARGMAQMLGGMQLTQAGMDFEQVNALIGSLFQFPEQIQALRVVVPKSVDPENGLDATVEMTPAADTWFAGFVSALKQTGKGVPALGSGNAMMNMAFDVDLAALGDHVKPLADFAMAMSGVRTDDEKGKAIKAMSDKMYDAWVGSLVMSWDASNGMRMVADVQDGAAVATMMDDPLYADLAKASGEMNPNAEVEFARKAYMHRDVAIASTKVLFDDPDMMPMAKDGVLETLVAVAGNQMVMAMFGGGKDAIAGLIDRALEPKTERSKLPANTMMTLDMRLADMVEQMAPQGEVPPGALDEMPARMDMSLAKSGKALVLKLTAK